MQNDIRTLASYDVVLTATNAEAAALNRELARAGGVLSRLVCSAGTWVDRLWELAGDGRSFVDSVTRVVAMSYALEGREGLDGPHLPTLLAQRMRDAVGSLELEAALDAVRAGETVEGLLSSELELLRALAAYEDELATLGLVEQGAAIAYLTNHLNEVFPQFKRVAVLGSAPLDFRLQALVDAASDAGLIELAYLAGADAELKPAPETTALRFAFPSGRYATPQLVLKVVDELAAQGPILISSRTPVELYEMLEPALADRGLSVAVRGNVPLARTTLGRLSLAIVRSLDDRELSWDKAALVDALANPLVGANDSARMRYDVILRENRLLTGGEALNKMPQPERLDPFAGLIAKPSDDTLASALKALSAQTALTPSEKDEQYAVFDVLATFIRTAEVLGRPLVTLCDALEGPLGTSRISVRRANKELAPGERADVLIEGMAQASAEPHDTFATILVLDLDSESYPAARKDGAVDLLMSRLGVPAPERSIERQRRQLASLVALPTQTLILGRCLTNSKADASYPAAVLEEFVDLYRDDVTLADDIDNLYSLPEQLQEGLITCGEDALVADVCPGLAQAGSRTAKEPPYTPPAVSFANDAITGAPLLKLSPAQIEAYLDCPAKWLVNRSFGISELDEVMGPRELGTFRHDVLDRFFKLFRETGQVKVCEENLDTAKTILGRSIHEVEQEYLELDDDGRPVKALRRCVALPNTSEMHTLIRARRELKEWLSFEASFLPGPATGVGASPIAFAPRAFELSLDDYDVTFAGARITGRIDRVDVSLDGSSFVVVDYKGSIGPTYDPELKDGELVLPTKLQTLIYAAAIARTPALQQELGITRSGIEAIAGAVYVSYKRGHAIRGTFTSPLSRERHLPTLPISAKPKTAEEMAALIDEVERIVATEVVAPILAGKTEPLPRKDACKYCPVMGCPRREGEDAS